jgi:nucleoside-diphosphate-sugar epimerase
VPRSVSPGVQRALASVMGVVEKALPIADNFRSETLRTLAGTTYTATSAKAQREWGYAPRSLEDGLPETLRNEMRLLGMSPPANG